MNGWSLSELERRLANLVRIGVIDQVDHAARRIRVTAGGMTSAWLPWPAEVGRNFKRWRPLRTGQQVVLAAPSGELAQAVVVGLLYSDSLDSPSTDEHKDLIQFDDGTRIEYDSGTSKLTIDCAGPVELTAPSTTITTTQSHQGDITITGNLTVSGLTTTGGLVSQGTAGGGGASITGTVTVTGGDVSADNISLKGHTHTEQGDGAETSSAN